MPTQHWAKCLIVDKLVFQNMSEEILNSSHSSAELQPDFERAELELLRESLRRSYKERFLMATRLYKIQQTMKKAVITRKPFISK